MIRILSDRLAEALTEWLHEKIRKEYWGYAKEELLKPAPNKAVLYGYAKEMGGLHKAMAEQMADHMLKVKTILTKDQFSKLLSNEMHPPGMREMHTGPHDAPHGQGPGGGHPPDFDD